LFFCYSYGHCQKHNVTYKNYELGELLVPEHIDLEDFNPYTFKRYLLSADTFGEYKQMENSSKLYEFLLDINMINGWEWLGKKSFEKDKDKFYASFPKDNYDVFFQPYGISSNFRTYLLKLKNKSISKEGNGWGLEYLFLFNVKGDNINNVTLLSITQKGGFGGSQDFTLNMGDYFYYTRDELYSDVIVNDDDMVLEKPLSQKFMFDENGRLEIIETKN